VGWSGVLYAAIVVGWAAYLIPHALRRHENGSRSRSIDRFSSALRVLRRRPSKSVSPKSVNPKSVDPAAQRSPVRRRAARVAAKRRRRILLLLLICTVATVAVAAYALVPWWSVAIPAALTVLFQFTCIRQARRQRRSRRAVARVVEPRPDLATAEPDDEPTVVLERTDIEEPAPLSPAADGLWDPVPVTLPTYVSKPKAPRTIRTIDLGQPGTWTSGRTAEAAAIAPEAAPPSAEAGAEPSARQTAQRTSEEPPRAVGT
jgi:hypothetical protein